MGVLIKACGNGVPAKLLYQPTPKWLRRVWGRRIRTAEDGPAERRLLGLTRAGKMLVDHRINWKSKGRHGSQVGVYRRMQKAMRRRGGRG